MSCKKCAKAAVLTMAKGVEAQENFIQEFDLKPDDCHEVQVKVIGWYDDANGVRQSTNSTQTYYLHHAGLMQLRKTLLAVKDEEVCTCW